MKKTFYALAPILVIIISASLPSVAFANDVAVKKSKSGICHAKGSTYYTRTKNYTPYPSMEACLHSGGRRPKR